MKKFVTVVLIIFLMAVLGIGMFIEKKMALCEAERAEESGELVADIADKIIRFHVIANSDTDYDQSLKLKVRDAVLEYAKPLLEDSGDVEESREILASEDHNIVKIAEKVISDSGYDYKVESTLTREYFPVKTYGNITLPQGEYEAYRIIIGTGEGHNWWCVMFPPICFTDITKGQVAYEETEREMKRVLTDDEMDLVENGRAGSHEEEKNENEQSRSRTGEEMPNGNDKIVDNSEDNNIVVKFKVFEVFRNLFD